MRTSVEGANVHQHLAELTQTFIRTVETIQTLILSSAHKLTVDIQLHSYIIVHVDAKLYFSLVFSCIVMVYVVLYVSMLCYDY